MFLAVLSSPTNKSTLVQKYSGSTFWLPKGWCLVLDQVEHYEHCPKKKQGQTQTLEQTLRYVWPIFNHAYAALVVV